jgi:ankyrin repeat protein
MVELLISKGVNVNAQNEHGKTALMLAAFSGKLNVIKELRANGARLDLQDQIGSAALHYAVDGGNLDAIQWLLQDGCEVNCTDNKSNWTPLLRAASINSSRDVAELLVKYGADVNRLDKDNKSALIIAVINGNQPFVQTLVEHGADLNITNEFGKTPYEMAVSMERKVNIYIFKLLINSSSFGNFNSLFSLCFQRVVKYFEEYFESNK